MNNKIKNSNFELLRIACMFLIVMYHFVVHGNIPLENVNLIQRTIVVFCGAFGKLGVVFFVMITGYFSWNRKLNYKRIVLLVSEVCFYSILLYCVSMLVSEAEITFKGLITAAFPIYNDLYWFFTCYIMLIVISPLLNIVINHFNESQLIRNCIIGFILFSLISTINCSYLYRNQIISFAFYYMVGACIQRCKSLNWKIRWDYLLLFGGGILFVLFKGLSFVTNSYLASILSDNVAQLYSFVFAIIGFAFLQICKKTTPHQNRFINYCSNSAFAIYLIHDNPYFKNILWQRFIKTSTIVNESVYAMILHLFVSVCLIMIISMCIDIVRRECLEKRFSSFLDTYIYKKENR